MSYRYIIIPLAQQDYEESVIWYQERSQQAAENFVLAVEHTLKLICNNPQRWRKGYKDFQELGIKKFPHSIIYKIETGNQTIVVTAIYHGKRNPKKRYRKIL